MSPNRRIVAVALVAVAASLAAAPAAADVVNLRTGEAVKGRLVEERSNDSFLVVEDFLTGALRKIAWVAVDEEDELRIKSAWNWTNSFTDTLNGVVIVLRLDDGSTVEIRGVVDRENDTQVFLRWGGDVRPIDKFRIASRDEEELDVRDVWTPEQLLDRYRSDLKEKGVDPENLDSRQRWDFAKFAEWIGEYEIAKESYATCAADEEFLKRDGAEQGVQRMTAFIQDRAANETLKNARLKLGMNLFQRVRGILDGFGESHPEAGEAMQAKAQELREDLNARRTKYFQQQAARRFVGIVEDLIQVKVREKDITITDVIGWSRRELPDEAFAILAGKFVKLDEVTPEEARAFWEGRPKRQWRRVSYGGGTFIVRQPQVKPPKRRRTGSRSGGRGSGGGGGAAAFQPPKPPTRDQWWKRAKMSEREKWVLAHFVENSELFELGDPELKPCPLCHGGGLISKTLQTGDVWTYLCNRCGGARHDVTVKYR